MRSDSDEQGAEADEEVDLDDKEDSSAKKKKKKGSSPAVSAGAAGKRKKVACSSDEEDDRDLPSAAKSADNGVAYPRSFSGRSIRHPIFDNPNSISLPYGGNITVGR